MEVTTILQICTTTILKITQRYRPQLDDQTVTNPIEEAVICTHFIRLIVPDRVWGSEPLSEIDSEAVCIPIWTRKCISLADIAYLRRNMPIEAQIELQSLSLSETKFQ